MNKFLGIALVGRAGAKSLFQGLGGTGRCGRRLMLACCAGLFGGTFSVVAQAADTAHPAKKPFPLVTLDKHQSGDEAVRGLGGKLPEVAAWYGMTPKTFASMLRADRMAWLDRNGRLLFIDAHRPPEPTTTASATTSISAGAFPAEQTFLLHSRPGAKRVIYLDFNGQIVSGTAWNNSYGVASIDAKAFDLDGSPTTFNTTELDRIQAIWQRVAEDYAPFDVDVTTEEPPADAITRSSSTDPAFGTRVVITNDWTKLTASSCNCGGFAYVGVYDDYGDTYKPAWVFFDNLGSGNEKYVAEAISHEAGHNLGLSHDGTTAGVSYYSGHGTGATGWAPIMGVGYYKELTQWSKGEYANANQTQDDLLVIQNTGAPLRADDHGDTLSTATSMNIGSVSGGMATLSGDGVISARNDIDVFSFHSGAGTVSFTASPGSRGPNLDIGLGLFAADGTPIASANPVDALNAALTVSLTQGGTYYLVVDGLGKGDPTTGYSDYASLGEYTLSGTAPASSGMPPVAVATATPTSGSAPLTVAFSSLGSSDPEGSALSYFWDFGDGSTSTDSNPTHVYASGSHVATLVVTDVTGATDTAQVSINVTPAIQSMHVSNIAMALTVKSSTAQASATATVLDASGSPVPGATVTGTWSGLVKGSSSGVTGAGGTVKLNSPTSRKRGTFTFTITGITLPGYTYDSAANSETSDFIVR